MKTLNHREHREHGGLRRVFLRVLCALCGSISFASCHSAAPSPESGGPAPLGIDLDHLRHLGRDLTVNGRRARVVALYAPAPAYEPTGSPTRDARDPFR